MLERDLNALFQARALPAYDRQLAFSEDVGGEDWVLDIDEAELRLGGRLRLPVQVLGTVSQPSDTWRWAWANSSVPDGLTSTSRTVRTYGEANSHPLLTTEEFQLSRVGDGHLIALVAAGIADADAYYRCPYEGGEALVAVQYGPARVAPSPTRAAHVLQSAMARLPLPLTRSAVEGFLSATRLTYDLEGSVIRVIDEPSFEVSFDSADRLAGLTLDEQAKEQPRRPAGDPGDGIPILGWSEPAPANVRNWLDRRDMSPVDVYRQYLTLRCEWERDAAMSGDVWPDRLAGQLEDIYTRLATPRSLEGRDLSYSEPPSRDPATSRVVAVEAAGSVAVTILTDENDWTGGSTRYCVLIDLLDGEWRIRDRIMTLDGESLSGGL